MAAAAEEKLFVTAPLVAVATTGGAVKQMYRGDIVTEDITKESVEHLKGLGFVGDNPLDAAKPEK